MNARARYDELADDLAAQNDDVTLGQMMGMPAIKRAGKMVGGFSEREDAMVFKLPDDTTRERALATTSSPMISLRRTTTSRSAR